MKEIVILGGGASGMAAAIAAAADSKRHITLVERQQRVGRKLLSSGNGRCNLSNLDAAPGRYHGADPDFVRPALEKFPPARILDFFAGLGLQTVTEYGGRVYPMSEHAGSVLDVLRLALDRPNVTLKTGAPAERVRRSGEGFVVSLPQEELRADKLIVACGGCAGSRLGGVTDGYQLLKSLGHSCTPLYPALTQLRTAPDYPRALKGIRAEGKITLRRGAAVLAEAGGDILFTDTGLSGTAVFEVSHAAAGQEGLSAVLCFFPGEESVLLADLRARRSRWPSLPANQILTGTAHSRLGQMLCRYAGISGGVLLGALEDSVLAALAHGMKEFILPVTGVSGFEAAQVTAGGIRTAEFDPDTLESRLVPGLYACGEVLDVDGDCGGFNLQWAWASGLLAGALR